MLNKNSLEHGDGFVICFSLLFLDVIWMSLVQLKFCGNLGDLFGMLSSGD